ncbi:redoxin domain-containing protein [bacterium]|nr:redoxin domain-containing protein [bacterium]
MTFEYKQTVRAPDFGKNDSWLNTDQSFHIKDLRGKVVLLDFWTYCCINCIHVLPKLHDLEEQYGDSLVVIGVHSAKFEDEGETENIRQAILRYNISHPVVNDRSFDVWNAYNVKAWPTMVLIDPEGYIVDTQSGEGAPDTFAPIIGQLARDYAKRGKLDTTPLNLALERDSAPPSLLEFPGKVRVDDASNTLIISDSNHNRILVADRTSGEVKHVIGNGQPGLKDGGFEDAQFNNPQGVQRVGDLVYIADTQNHALRVANLETGEVTTLAGTGEQGRFGSGPAPAKATALASPWAVAWVNPRLFIAMAGPHQIWYYDPAKDEVGLWAGSGRENLVDGPRVFAALAQPSGLTFDGRQRLFFADSEVSAIRSVDTTPGGLVSTVVGRGLFDFGDVDGTGTEVRLQHPLGVSWHEGSLYVADTYNNKIKLLGPGTRSSTTFAGSGNGGYKDGSLLEAHFDEPGGLDVASDGLIYVADTNNHLIRVINPAADTVGTFVMKGLSKVMGEMDDEQIPSVILPVQAVAPGNGSLKIVMTFPDGYKLNPEGGLRISLKGRPGVVTVDDMQTFTMHVPVEIPVTFTAGMGELDVTMDYVYCRKDNEGLCYFGNVKARLPINVTTSAASARVSIAHSVEDPGL